MKSKIDKLKVEYSHLEWWRKVCQDKIDDISGDVPPEAKEIYHKEKRQSRARQKEIVQILYTEEGIYEK